MLALQALVYIERNDWTGRPFWNYATGTLTPWKEYQTALSSSTTEKCPPMQIVKQPEYGRASTTKEHKCPSFQTNYD